MDCYTYAKAGNVYVNRKPLSAALAEIITNEDAHGIAALQLPMLLPGIGALVGSGGLLQGGVLFVETGEGKALVGVLRALVLHLDAQAACGVRRPDGSARFIDVLPAFAACLAALHGNVAARDVARCRQRKDADEPVFAPVLGADATLPNPLNRPRPARGEGGCILALQLNHGGMDAVRAAVFTADAGADACRRRFLQ